MAWPKAVTDFRWRQSSLLPIGDMPKGNRSAPKGVSKRPPAPTRRAPRRIAKCRIKRPPGTRAAFFVRNFGQRCVFTACREDALFSRSPAGQTIEFTRCDNRAGSGASGWPYSGELRPIGLIAKGRAFCAPHVQRSPAMVPSLVLGMPSWGFSFWLPPFAARGRRLRIAGIPDRRC
jgi:hypothetical protein